MAIQLTLTKEDIEIIYKLPGVRAWDGNAFIIRAIVYAVIYEGQLDPEAFEKAMKRAATRRGPKKQ